MGVEGGCPMNYLKQFCVIIIFSFLGELCRWLIPYPIPASIYGMVLLFAALSLKIVRVEQLRDGSSFLVSCLPVLFVAPAVSLMACWDQLKNALVPLLVIVLAATVLTFGVAGVVTQWLLGRRKGGSGHA